MNDATIEYFEWASNELLDQIYLRDDTICPYIFII